MFAIANGRLRLMLYTLWIRCWMFSLHSHTLNQMAYSIRAVIFTEASKDRIPLIGSTDLSFPLVRSLEHLGSDDTVTSLFGLILTAVCASIPKVTKLCNIMFQSMPRTNEPCSAPGLPPGDPRRYAGRVGQPESLRWLT